MLPPLAAVGLEGVVRGAVETTVRAKLALIDWLNVSHGRQIVDDARRLDKLLGIGGGRTTRLCRFRSRIGEPSAMAVPLRNGLRLGSGSKKP